MYIFLDFREPALLNLHSHMFLSAAQSLASATSRKDTTSYTFTKRVNHHRSGLVGRTSGGGNTVSAKTSGYKNKSNRQKEGTVPSIPRLLGLYLTPYYTVSQPGLLLN